MNLEGKLLGNRYEIIEKIGNGGMATVYKAKCHVLNRYVAVKVLRDEFTTDEEFIRRFGVEAQSAASLAHPNIVSIYDVGNEGNLYYIVMELIKGKTLKEIINEDGPLPWKWSINIAIQIASALETAHKNNIIHRDIKPHNIIITEEGIAKVTDFGIAKAVSNSTITAFGTTIGSVHYFSPEHARGGFTDAKSDLYSLGVVMYEMLTGKVPFDADTPVSVALKHMQEEPIPPIDVNSNIPLAVNKIILKAMQKDINLRYSSATEMLRDLNLALKNPDGGFVFIRGNQNDFPTQKIPIYDNVVREEPNNRNTEKKQNSEKKKNKLGEFIRKHKVLSMFVGAILLFFLAFGGTALLINLTEVKEVQIPNLVGLSKEEAEQQLKNVKIEFEIESEEYDDELEAGKIISQDPPYVENYKIKEKSKIKVIVSKGVEIVKVPKIAGLSREDALEELKKVNLEAEETEETSKKVEEGYVIKQDPDANTEVNAGSKVKVVISKGTGIIEVTVPGVIGQTEEAAKAKLASSKLKVNISYDEDTTKDNGVVLKQDIDAGKTVEENTTINIVVNKLTETKHGKVNINVKSLLAYTKPELDENGVEINTTAKVMVKVNDDVVYNEVNKKDTENINVDISGKGTVTVKVYIDGVLKKQGDLNLNSSNPVFTAE